MRGPRPESACASVSAFSVRGGVWLAVGVFRQKLTLVLAVKGNLRYRFFNSRGWCTGTPDTNQELDQVSLPVSQGTTFADAFVVSFSVKS